MSEYSMKFNSEKETPVYKCGVCGKSYNSIKERMECETKCISNIESLAKKATEAKLKAEKEKRFDELKTAIKNANALVGAYEKDYDVYLDFDKMYDNTFNLSEYPKKNIKTGLGLVDLFF